VFKRFTERARHVIVVAQDESRALKHDYIGTEHILLGLLREEEGLAARVLESLSLTVEEVRAQVARLVGQGDEAPTGQIPFTPRAKKVLELSLREALTLGHDYIGTEHILLGLARENEGVAARVLREAGISAIEIHEAIIRLLPGPGRARPERPPASLPYLAAALQQAKSTAMGEQNFDRAARLDDMQRKLRRVIEEIQDEVGAAPPGADDARWEYEVRTLEGSTETWPEQLSAWRHEGWELLVVVEEGGAHRAMLERRT
jgi:ATP-dependent Clp protease ATP-binding subunit ClpC